MSTAPAPLNFTSRKCIRKSFGRIESAAELPNLIEMQKQSYDGFLQINIPKEERRDSGLQAVLKSVFPINDFNETATVEFVSYDFDPPKYDVEECRQRDINFAAPMRATLRLITWIVDEDTGAREIQDIKEQDVYMGDIPLMTENGTFIINGTERVIVSQMHRSPGVFFDHDKGKSHSSGKLLYNARIIPYRGSWLDFEFDPKDIVHTRIDRRRKLPVTTLLRALDMDTEEILSTYYETITLKKASGKGDFWVAPYLPERYRGIKLVKDLIDGKTGKVVAEAGVKLTPRKAKKLLEDGMTEIRLSAEEVTGHYFARNLVNKDGEVLADAGAEVTEAILNLLTEGGIKELPVLDIDNIHVGPYMRNTLMTDKNTTKDDALMDIYKVMRPGEPTTPEAAEALFLSLFFDSERYDLSDVGRVKINARLGLEFPEEQGTLTKEDIIESIRTLVRLKDGHGIIDDIDHLGNRRVRSVGELMENQYRIGLLRMERSIIERMGSVDIDTVMPHDLVNAKPVAAAVREFFGSSQLSQFMDQTNPLSEITHKRRLSALGPGGLTRERAGFEVRDVHPTHYGRICPIETPEGPNIGLINSIATYARVNKYGFIETPYRKVVDSKVTDEVVYLSAIEEGKYTVAQANAPLDKNNKFSEDLVPSRKAGDFQMSQPEDIDFIDVAPKQLVSVAAALIPFLENDDANRALMGSNMQRQAVPLLQADAPLVGTGMEAVVARDSGAALHARRGGIVEAVDASRIVIRVSENETSGDTPGVDIYNLQKFQRSNQNTCINQRPLVKVGDKIESGDIIVDGPSTELGELAVGRNVLVAFMPWNGYNFEDSILISERMVSDDVFTSIHIEEFEVVARDTKLGPEEITRDIPNVGEEALRNLDEIGVVHIGAEVKAGDILVGKVTPKSESPMTPEEKLLRAIFGEKASDVRDSSLRVPPGQVGTIVGVRIFSRRGIEKDERALAIESAEIEKLAKDRDSERRIIENYVYGTLQEYLVGQDATAGPKGFKKGKITPEHFEEYSKGQWWQFAIKDDALMNKIEALKAQLDEALDRIEKHFSEKVEKVQSGDDLAPGVLKMVKVFMAIKRKLQPGDKMAGRHGNKGVISKIIPVEDMPYLEDGTPVDVVLNPLGVPSRMNVGQILETHLGWASAGIGRQIGDALEASKRVGETKELRNKLTEIYDEKQYSTAIKKMTDEEVMELAQNTSKGVPFATPVFDGAHEQDIEYWLERAGLPSSGQMSLWDGRTGEKFDRDVTVGYIYMLKLHHLVDEKIHARSIGPYSLVTQQPLGGKSQFGGQRFGEMECWALQAYGAAYTLQEMLTVKSDDVAGRSKVYESIVRGDHSFESGIPESFHVMVKELRALCLNVELKENEA
jgi:DNA-directed RNA polymerase subunit beta